MTTKWHQYCIYLTTFRYTWSREQYLNKQKLISNKTLSKSSFMIWQNQNGGTKTTGKFRKCHDRKRFKNCHFKKHIQICTIFNHDSESIVYLQRWFSKGNFRSLLSDNRVLELLRMKNWYPTGIKSLTYNKLIGTVPESLLLHKFRFRLQVKLVRQIQALMKDVLRSWST